MQPGPPASAATKPPRRRVRSESDRKKHAGWRRCPRCARSVSTNGRNFYHHMHKCDRVYFADVIARIDATRAKLPNNTPPPQPNRPPTAPLLSPTTPPRPTARVPLTDNQRTIFIQQLCFLRVYDRTVDSVFRQVESSHNPIIGPSVFEAVRIARRNQAAQPPQVMPYSPPAYSPAASSPPPRNHYAPVPLPEALTSPLTPHQAPIRSVEHHYASASGLARPTFVPMTAPYQQPHPQPMYQSPHFNNHQQQLPALSATMSAVTQASPISGSNPTGEGQPRDPTQFSAGMYGGVAPLAAPNYLTSSQGANTQTMAAPPNFSAPTYASASPSSQPSVSTPAITQGMVTLHEQVASKGQQLASAQNLSQVPISASTPTSVSASVSTTAPASSHIPTSANVIAFAPASAPMNTAQPIHTDSQMMSPASGPVCAGPGRSEGIPVKQESTVPTSEVQQPVSSRSAAPRQTSAMSIASVINK